jgi:hypothetical protein
LKFADAWVKKNKDSFPYILAQSIAAIARNGEDNLRRKAINHLISLAIQATKVKNL